MYVVFYPIVIPKGGRKAGNLRFDSLSLKIPTLLIIGWLKRVWASVFLFRKISIITITIIIIIIIATLKDYCENEMLHTFKIGKP